MGDLTTLPTFQASPTSYLHTDFNALFQALTIAPGAVTFSKFQAIAADNLLGRATAGNGNVELIPCPAFGRNVISKASVIELMTLLNLSDGTALHGTTKGFTVHDADADIMTVFGQDATHHAYLKWFYNATAGSAIAELGTYGKTNQFRFVADNFDFHTSGLASALRVLAAGRVMVGGGADDATGSAFQVTGALSATNKSGTRANLGLLGSNLNSDLAAAVNVTLPGTVGTDVVFNAVGAPSITLTPGTWLLVGGVSARTSDATDSVWARFYNSTDAAAFGGGPAQQCSLGNLVRESLPVMGEITVAANKTIHFKVFRGGASTLDVGSDVGPSGYMQAVRLSY